ncbi:MAG: PIN domain-containing protein [Candidatus Abyssobacteria bacterium SURF_5]|uniref:Ribonuclease VapC n=1 Tax=Abyssobacteria bacterium (strain SURF_5) TaxID=2093360 RepID=A0A3A4NQ19_ABYX5|nr:MAG: PIN domain-containing protein [Candidatus Abyssubacteria bacterium SURF_5]
MTARFVVDNSVIMAWCFEDVGDRFAEAVLESLETCEAVVPAIWPLEVGNVLLVAERKKRLSQADVIRFVSLLYDLPIVIEQETPERMLKEILALAREQHLTTYDASYLDLAMRLGLPIATRDQSLSKAAKKSRVPAFDPAKLA